MQIRNSKYAYGAGAQFFHWLLFILLAFMIALGNYLEGMEDTPDKFKLIALHKSIGITILTLAILRLGWRLINPAPPLPADLPAYQKIASQAVHWLLYFLIFAIPLTGWLYSSIAGFPVSVFGWFVLPNLAPANKELTDTFHSVHGFFGDMLIVTFVIHVAAALYHQFIRKDEILMRMAPFGRIGKDQSPGP